MPYYLHQLADGTPQGTWDIGRREARLIAGQGPSPFRAVGGQTIWTTIRAGTPWYEPAGHQPFHRLKLGPGQFYPFIARAYDLGPYDHSWCPSELTETDMLARSHGQLIALTEQLSRICQTVQPTTENFRAFGHDIRNLLILASTEVEAHWANVMRANGVTKKDLTRDDYIRLATPMGLRDFTVRFPRYPWLDPIRPFAGWGRGARLSWYDAYNQVKHDRERHFKQATLQNALKSVAACAVMIEAQFGTHKALIAGSVLPSFFQFASAPYWPPAKIYLSEGVSGWRPVNEPSLSSPKKRRKKRAAQRGG